ncbi:MAG: hypothetical protein KGJ02_08725 [Verrucomicrobiota bacterium]|nr:hypothetical protein [Verrucomicrobiota bacterium]
MSSNCTSYDGRACLYPQCFETLCLIDEPISGPPGFPYAARGGLATALKVGPPLLGALSFLRETFQNARPLKQAIQATLFSLAKSPDESLFDYVKRISSFTALKTALIASGTAVVGNFLGPSALAIGAGALYLTVRAPTWKAALIQAFTRQAEESEAQARARIQCNLLKAFCGTVCLGLCTAGIAIYLPQVLEQSTEYQIWLPGQAPAVAFLEYAGVAMAHLFLAKKSTSKKMVIYYLLNASASLSFPIAYLADPSHNGPLRLHHSWIGQSLQLLPSVNLKVLGVALSLDSINYLADSPGYHQYGLTAWGDHLTKQGTPGEDLVIYGGDNVLVDNVWLALDAFSVGCGLELLGHLLSTVKSNSPAIEENVELVVRRANEG